MAAMESIVAGNAPYETWYPATAVPVVGTDSCGLPREGVVLSFTASHVQIEGCRLKSVNHSHAVSASGSTSARERSLTLTAHLHRSGCAQQIFRRGRLFRWALHPDAVASVREPGIVADHHRETRHPRVNK